MKIHTTSYVNFPFLLCLIGLFLIFSSCQKDKKEIIFSFNISSINLPAEGGLTKLSITTNTKWHAASNQDWITVSPDNGYENEEITIYYDPNGSLESRTAEIIFTGDGIAKKSVALSQTFSGVLEAPMNLSAVFSEKENIINIKWETVINAESYRVYYSSKENGTYQLLGETKETSIADHVRNRYYKVKAIKGTIESKLSDYAVDSPRPPTGLSAIFELSSNSVRISWIPVAEATRYRIYYSRSLTESFNMIGETGETSMSDNSRYGFYKVSSVTNEIEGELSDYIVELPSPPANLIAVYSQLDNAVKISWDDVQVASSYRVYYSEAKMGEFKLLKELDNNLLLDVSRNRYYKVTSVNKGGESDFLYIVSENGRENKSEPLVDIDGNTYRTVQIGSQTWMAENLRVTKASDGIALPMVVGASAWKALNATSRAYSYYDNSKEFAITNELGALYTWEAAKAACPEGWRLPTSEDWQTLFSYVEKNASNSDPNVTLKSTKGWRTPGTDEYGFGAKPGGKRTLLQGFSEVSFQDGAYWWANDVDRDKALGVGSYYFGGTLNNYYYTPMYNGLAVRYIKN